MDDIPMIGTQIIYTFGVLNPFAFRQGKKAFNKPGATDFFLRRTSKFSFQKCIPHMIRLKKAD